MSKRFLMGLVAASTWLIASAAPLTKIDTPKSTITFGYTQMGVASEGVFKKFSATMQFDPANVAASQLNFVVDVSSIETGVPGGDDEVKGKAWLNAKQFPQASFVANKISSTAANQYTASGNLTMKGITQAVTIPFKLTGNSADGQFKFKRSVFKIGEGEWADTSVVADDVVVKFHLTLQ